jgi:hypothetical protein
MVDDPKSRHIKNEIDTKPVVVARVEISRRHATPGSFTKGNRPAGANKGKPVGTLNKITRTMKDAAIAAAEELGHYDVKDWNKLLVGDPRSGVKAYFMFLAVKHPKSFAVILARILPLQIKTDKSMPTYLTEDQVIAELKEAGLPVDLIKHMRAVDSSTLGPEYNLDYNPYSDPEETADDERLVDETPKTDTTE